MAHLWHIAGNDDGLDGNIFVKWPQLNVKHSKYSESLRKLTSLTWQVHFFILLGCGNHDMLRETEMPLMSILNGHF